MNILRKENPEKCTTQMINVLLQGRKILTSPPSPNPWDWLRADAWANVDALMQSLDLFGDLKSSVESSVEALEDWKNWVERPNPEAVDIPHSYARLNNHPAGSFMRLLLIRSFREDRTRVAVAKFVEDSLNDPFFAVGVPLDLAKICQEDSAKNLPVLMMLTPGSDPNQELNEQRKALSIPDLRIVSMGEGQEKSAKEIIVQGFADGGWALLENCHLGLSFMSEIPQMLDEAFEAGSGIEVQDSFRLFITCEPHNAFPVDLLQRSIKVTLEAPAGLKAGLERTWAGSGASIHSERFGRQDNPIWRDQLLCISFIHSIVQERRKFGPIGFNIPYEFNQSDLEASLTFLETHISTLREGDSKHWETVKYMITEVQYGGRITDDRDRWLFQAFGRLWLKDFNNDRNFWSNNPAMEKYHLVAPDEVFEKYVEYVTGPDFPDNDSPEVFGLHPNADLSYGTDQTTYLLDTITETRPKDSSSNGNEDTAEVKATKWAIREVKDVPEPFIMYQVRETVMRRPRSETKNVLGRDPNEEDLKNGMGIPLNMFLFQEIERLDVVIRKVRKTLLDLVLAIKGEIIMTPMLVSTLANVTNGKPPDHWLVDAWNTPGVAEWLKGLNDRYEQLSVWLWGRNGAPNYAVGKPDDRARPATFWMTGFFNPQGFLTCLRQEVTRKKKLQATDPATAAKWGLDQVELSPLVQFPRGKGREGKSKPSQEGLLIRGLFMEGAKMLPYNQEGKVVQQSSSESIVFKLTEAEPRELYSPIPMLYVTAILKETFAVKFCTEDKVQSQKFFNCPCYTTRARGDLAFVAYFKLPNGPRALGDDSKADHWTLRGAAMLCSTS
jgi:dynein heavy chain